MSKNICLYDSQNQCYNLGEEHAVFTPHCTENSEADLSLNPDFEDQKEDFWTAINDFKDKELDGFIITGRLGLWDGSHDIFPVYYSTLAKAIGRCIENTADARVDIQDGIITFCEYHHDGRNIYQIRGFTTEGMTDQHKELFGEISDGGFISDELLETEKYIRKIHLLEHCGFIEENLTATNGVH